MANKATYQVKFRRRREEKTNYPQRLALLKSTQARIVVRKSLQHILVQAVQYSNNTDSIIVGTSSSKLKKMGWKYHCGNIPSAYLTGLWVGKQAKEKGVNEAVLDLGLQQTMHGGVLFAVLKGCLDAGINIPHDGKVLPSADRIEGKHISAYASSLSEDDRKKRFSNYYKNGLNPVHFHEDFLKMKEKILKEK